MSDDTQTLAILKAAAIRASGKPLLDGMCSVLSMMVKRAVGGEVLEGYYNGEVHYWNLLTGGLEVDLTGAQFGGDGWTPVCESGIVKEDPELVPIEALVAMSLIAEEITNLPQQSGVYFIGHPAPV